MPCTLIVVMLPDLTQPQLIVRAVCFDQVDSKRKKGIKTEVSYSHETEFHTEA